mmetsp:Transcript_27680/g.52689  ORF Transcript_27680/g.52689 Transcript_27680/m.52689 type:complete len:209 (-) Transcript_27680:854-1480(-)
METLFCDAIHSVLPVVKPTHPHLDPGGRVDAVHLVHIGKHLLPYNRRLADIRRGPGHLLLVEGLQHLWVADVHGTHPRHHLRITHPTGLVHLVSTNMQVLVREQLGQLSQQHFHQDHGGVNRGVEWTLLGDLCGALAEQLRVAHTPGLGVARLVELGDHANPQAARVLNHLLHVAVRVHMLRTEGSHDQLRQRHTLKREALVVHHVPM